MKQVMKLVCAIATVTTLAACGTTSISPSQEKSQAVAFPDAKSAWMKEGTFVNLDNLRMVKAGLTKDQLYDLLGRPHFSEGLFSVREWDYIFNFRKGAQVVTCQFKVKFDQDYKATSFHWLPAGCGDTILTPVAQPVAQAPAAAAVVPKEMSPAPTRLSADALFAFGKSGMQDLQPEGRRELEVFAKKVLAAGELRRLTVVGYTDRMGDAAYNQALSQERAKTVRDFLVARGISAARIATSGLGEGHPLVECSEVMSRDAQISCLAPNRRVELAVEMVNLRD